jgi:hypothetical protein
MCDSFLVRGTDEKESVIEKQCVVKGSDSFRTNDVHLDYFLVSLGLREE